MVIDDHDVTDDWNLGRAWRDRVFTAPLGRRVVTSALVAYVAFQDWGNDPVRYRKGPYRTTLDLASSYQPLAQANPGDNDPGQATVKLLEKLFGLNQPDPEEPAPQLKWHFSIDGPRHRVLVLDTRTRRVYRSRYLPAGLLSPKALAEQIPDPHEQPLPSGIEMLVVVSQTPPVLPTIATRYIVPAKTRIVGVQQSPEVSSAHRARARQRDLARRRPRLRGPAQAARRVPESRRALGRGAFRRGRRADLLDERAETARPRRAVRGRPQPYEPDRHARAAGRVREGRLPAVQHRLRDDP